MEDGPCGTSPSGANVATPQDAHEGFFTSVACMLGNHLCPTSVTILTAFSPRARKEEPFAAMYRSPCKLPLKRNRLDVKALLNFRECRGRTVGQEALVL